MPLPVRSPHLTGHKFDYNVIFLAIRLNLILRPDICTMSEKRIRLQPTHCYHIYNQAVGNDCFFNCDHDYTFFLMKSREYILPVTDIFAYCLQPKNFHLAVRIKSREEILEYLSFKLGDDRFNRISKSELFIESQLSRIYSDLFSTYAKHYNERYSRIGTLFKRAFMREAIETHEKLPTLINDIHLRPVKLAKVSKPEEWKYSSFNSILKNKPSIINRDEVLRLYGGLENCFASHKSHFESGNQIL